MTTKLKIAPELSLPLDAATESFAILGRRGSGKTHTAVVCAEELLKAGVQVVVTDPLDVWWGLRVSKDGKHAGFSIYVAGGSHQDIPLSADSGKVLADAVVDQGLSIILSTRHLSKSDQRRFVGDFCERLYDRKADPQHRTALHVIIDEADAFVPQRLMPGAERCFGAVDTLVRRGRSSGLAVTLISQRPQVINKDVLSQTEVLVAHQLTGPQDRKALQAWIEANDDANRSAEFMGALASLPKGRAWFWSPGLLKIFKPVDVRDRETFDSSATPKPGVAGVKPRAFATVDLEKLTKEIAATIEKAKADDPRELRKQIAELTKALKISQDRENSTAVLKNKHESPKRVEVLTDADRELLKQLRDEWLIFTEAIADKADAMLTSLAERAKAEIDRAADAWVENIDKRRGLFAARLEQTRVQKIFAKLDAVQKAPATVTIHASASARPATREALHQVARALIKNPPRKPLAPDEIDSRLHTAAGETKKHVRGILSALAQHPEGLSREQTLILAAYQPSGDISTAFAAMLERGWIVGIGNQLRMTVPGLEALGDFDPLPTGSKLRELVLSKGSSAERKMLRALFDSHPAPSSRADLHQLAGLRPSGDTSTALAKFLKLGWMEERDGGFVASDTFYEEELS